MQEDKVKNWPFPTKNGQRTEESKELLNQKFKRQPKDDFSDVEEAMF